MSSSIGAPFIGTRISGWYQTNQRSLPWRELWLKTKDPYVVWISEIFLQQTQIATVIPKYNLFIKKYPTIESLLSANETEFKNIVSGLGYYRRFANILKAADYIVNSCEGQFPSSYDTLLEVPGIGPYTASAISSICFGEPKAVLDGNVERVICRLNNFQKPPNLPSIKKELQSIADAILDPKNPGDFNQGIMELGQLVCKPTNPECNICPIKSQCAAYRLETQHLAPAKKIKKKATECYLNVYVSKKKSMYGLQARNNSSKFLKNTTGFYLEEAAKKPNSIKDLTFKHTITHHKITAKVVISEKPPYTDSSIEWFTIDKLAKQLQTSFDKKVLKILEQTQ